MKRNKPSALARLMHGVDATQFLDHIWAQSSCVAHGPVNRLTSIASLPELQDADALLDHAARASNPSVIVGAWFQDANGVQTSANVDAITAKQLYRAGNVTIVVNYVDAILPSVRKLLDSIQKETGTPGFTSCNAYLSPRGAGTKMHFDSQEAFLVQLRGKKKWLYAPNEKLPFPGPDLLEIEPAELARLPQKMPARMPKNSKRTVLSPGSVLYMTRGTWHECITEQESLALTLTFASDTWRDVITHMLRDTHMRNQAWRRPAVGITSGGARGRAAQQHLEALVAELHASMLTESKE